MLQNEGNFMGAYFQHGSRAGTAFLPAKARIEKAGIVDAEFADLRVIGNHLRRVAGRNTHRLARRQYIEFVGIKDKIVASAPCQSLPELPRIVMSDLLQIDDAGVPLGAVTYGTAFQCLQIDGKDKAAADLSHGFITQQADLLMQFLKCNIAEVGAAAAQTQLIEPRALVHQDRKSIGCDFCIKRPLITRRNRIELAGAVDNETRENIEPPGG